MEIEVAIQGDEQVDGGCKILSVSIKKRHSPCQAISGYVCLDSSFFRRLRDVDENSLGWNATIGGKRRALRRSITFYQKAASPCPELMECRTQ